ncbi:MAG: SpoIIE family protein phosphatase, partial [Gammaproteobacteria bacterium]|nr:SpoIIE family protein phosphatase [Gammaproteobacteria bacterium]
IPLFLLSGAFFTYLYKQEVENEKILELNQDQQNLELQDSIISGELNGLSADILFLADLVHDYLIEGRLQQISDKLLSFAAHSGAYDQLRFLDASGMERVRINYNNGQPYSIPPSKLQDKRSRYYFKESISLNNGQLFLSPFDLNMEENVIQQPLKPVLRIATPIYNNAGEKLGVIILNYLGNRLFSKMEQSQHCDCQFMLLNQQGYWLLGPDKNMNWGFMYPDRKQMTFELLYPEAWEKISSLENGHKISPDGTFTWRSAYPLQYSHVATQQDDNNQKRLKSAQTWKIVVLRKASFIARTLEPVTSTYLTIFIFLTIGLALVSALITYLRVRQLKEIDSNELLQEAQLLTNKLLKTALISTQTMQQEMSDSLAHILSSHWLSVLSKGSIFILDEKSNELVMIAEQGLAKPLLTKCARLPIGRCLCGMAAERKETIFTSCLDHQHEITFDGITEHGHICVPILKDDKLLGVLNLYVEHGDKYNPLYDDMLKLITNVLVVIIERQQVDDELKDVHEQIKENRDELAFERNIVEDTLLRIRSAEEFDMQDFRYLMAPVESTAGDILLSSFRPDGTRHIMLGDFTGHGLPSALAGPAVADTFYAMTRKGLPALKILTEINAKLVEKLPPHLFLAACFIEFTPSTNRLSLWNASLPKLTLFRSGLPVEYYKSTLLALGIIKDLPLADAEQVIDLKSGDLLYAFTDGVIEASDAEGVMFGEERFEALLSSIIKEKKPLETIIDVLDDYQVGDEQLDDITMLEIHI